MNSQSKQRPGKTRPDYSVVTEIPGNRVTAEAVRMLHSRYAYAAGFCEGKDVLEVACGAGQGLGHLAKRARCIVGGDYTSSLLDLAQQHYAGRVPLVRFDAHSLPFRDQSFDVVLLFEAIYYLAHPQQFLAECRRVMRVGGTLLICSANSEWSGFNPSPFSTRYFSASDLQRLLSTNGFEAEVYGAFSPLASTQKQKVVAFVRKFAARWNLIPKTMKGKESLKRLFYGQLAELSAEIDEQLAKRAPLCQVSGNGESKKFKVLYAVARPRCDSPVAQ